MDATWTVLWTALEAGLYSMPTLLLIAPLLRAGFVRRASWHVNLADYGCLVFLLAALCRLALPLHFWSDEPEAVRHVVAIGSALVFWWGVAAVAMSRAAVKAFTSRFLLHGIVLTQGAFFPGVIHFSRQSPFTGDNWLVLIVWFPCFLISLAMVWLIVYVKHEPD